MQKVKAISLVVLGFLLAYASSKFFEPETNLDKQILNVSMSTSLSVVGFRNNSGNATVGYHYNFYIKSDGVELSTPFLVSDTPNVEVNVEDVNHLSITISGKVYQFTNVVWVKDNGQLAPVKIDFIATP
ncbi:hypothetical protein [Marinomonas sp. THO17]|uniref:hypothetical protein n=1 Tax=Marinomonas sp. THO17 TaxID=3149048 RepID=UPI00336C2148